MTRTFYFLDYVLLMCTGYLRSAVPGGSHMTDTCHTIIRPPHSL
jgi:hypothetical protein